MALNYTVKLSTQTGTFVKYINNFASLNLSLVTNDYGVCSLIYSDKDLSIYNSLDEDYRLTIVRNGYTLAEGDWLIRKIVKEYTTDGKRLTTITAATAVILLNGPIVAYNAGTAQTTFTDNIDDGMKQIVRENLGSSATDTDRDMSTYLSVASDLGAGPSVTKHFSRQKVLELFQTLADLAAQQGTPVFFDIVASGSHWQFRTYTGQRGTDRSTTLKFSLGRKTLTSASFSTDYFDAKNYVYAGGQGQGENRNVQVASDTDRINNSIFGRIREDWHTDTNLTADASILSVANARLYEQRPKTTFEGTLRVTSTNDLGTHWFPGDKVSVDFDGVTFTAIISPVQVSLSSEGRETINATLRSAT